MKIETRELPGLLRAGLQIRDVPVTFSPSKQVLGAFRNGYARGYISGIGSRSQRLSTLQLMMESWPTDELVLVPPVLSNYDYLAWLYWPVNIAPQQLTPFIKALAAQTLVINTMEMSGRGAASQYARGNVAALTKYCEYLIGIDDPFATKAGSPPVISTGSLWWMPRKMDKRTMRINLPVPMNYAGNYPSKPTVQILSATFTDEVLSLLTDLPVYAEARKTALKFLDSMPRTYNVSITN